MPAGPVATRPVAVLIGPPGSGKTTVARTLAKLLGVGFRDTDRDLEDAAGRRIRDILEQEGEAHFRVRERRAVHRALTEHDGVLALGGGAVLEESTQLLLRGHTVVHLAVSVAQLTTRIGAAKSRPLLVDDPQARLRTLLTVRTPIYRRLATHTVSGDGPSRLVAARIAALLRADRLPVLPPPDPDIPERIPPNHRI